MIPRERLRAALNHKQPDRVPMDLASTRNTGIELLAYERLVNYLGYDINIQPLGTTDTSRILGLASPDEMVLNHLGIDTRGIFLSPPDRWKDIELPNDAYQDKWGTVWKRPVGSRFYDPIKFPLAGDISLKDIANYPWPDLSEDPGYTRGLKDRAEWLHDKTDFGLVLHLRTICLHDSQWLRGYENWYMDFYLNPDILCIIMDTILEHRIAVASRALDLVGDLVDVVSCSDDIADQRGPIVSPLCYRKYIKPRHRRFFDMIHSKTNAKILFHTCGSIIKLLPDLIEIGVDFINPVQVSAKNMDNTAYLKKEFGDDIGFWGGIDNLQVLPNGAPEDVYNEVKRRVEDLGNNGGYILSAIHNIQPDVPPENIVALFEAGRSF